MSIVQSDRIPKRSPKACFSEQDDLYFMTHERRQTTAFTRSTTAKTWKIPLHPKNRRRKRAIKGQQNIPTEAPESWMAMALAQWSFREVFGDQGQSRRQIDADRSTRDEHEHVKE